MLDKLSLHSFQAHKDTVLEFSPGVNIITGVSNSGKTSIVRALNLLVNNRPGGEGFINDDERGTAVVLSLRRRDSAFEIHRERDRKSVNLYRMRCSNGDSEEYKAFGSSVPEEIRNILNFSDINLQQQLSPYFLVLDSPGQVALYIRKVARLDEIDEVVSVLSSEVRDSSRKKSNLDEELVKVLRELEELSVIDLERLESIINEVKLLEESKKLVSQQSDEISTIIELIKQIERAMIYLPDDIEEKINLVDENLLDYERFLTERNCLQDIVTSLKEIEATKISIPEDIENNIIVIETLIVKYNNSEREFICLQETIETLEEYGTEMNTLNEEISIAEKIKKDFLSQLTDCPYCGRTLSAEAQKVLIGEQKGE